MEIYTNTAHGTALLSHSPKAVEKSLKLKKPNTHTSLGREYTSLWGKVSFCVVSNRQHSLFLVGINPSVLSHLWCIQPHTDLISNTHTHTHMIT